MNKHTRFNVKPKVPGTYSVNSPEMSTEKGTISAAGSVARNLSSGYHLPPRFFR